MRRTVFQGRQADNASLGPSWLQCFPFSIGDSWYRDYWLEAGADASAGGRYRRALRRLAQYRERRHG